GVVENIDTTSRQLKDALESGKTIIVTTLQKFPVIAKEIGELPGKRFALIVDEAHSSQSGESTKSLKAVLSSGSLEEAETEEEGFMLYVLANYATYKAYWRLLKKVEDDPRYDKRKAEFLLKSFVELHPHAIGEKVKICVEHFAAKVQGEIGGKAKTMIVTRSRRHAVRYKLAVDRYLAQRGYPFKALVAFSGRVEDVGGPYTESG